MAALARRDAQPFPSPARLRPSPALGSWWRHRSETPTQRWQRQAEAAAALWQELAPMVEAAIAFGFNRAQLVDVLSRAYEGEPEDFFEQVADELAARIL